MSFTFLKQPLSAAILVLVIAIPLRAAAQSAPANPSFSSPADKNLLTHDFNVVFFSSPATINVPVYNLGSSPTNAALTLHDISVIGDSTEIKLLHGPFAGVVPGGSASLQLKVEASALGELAANFLLSFSSDGLPAAPYQLLTINAFVEVILGGDFDADRDVDGADFLAWQRNINVTEGAALSMGDANRDGAVNQSDLQIWQTYMGQTAPLSEIASSAVPEPSTAELSALAFSSLIAGGRRAFYHISVRRCS